MNPPFRPSPISAKKSINPARTGANLATNLTGQVNAASNQGRRDAHQDKRDAHPGRRDAHPDSRDAHPDRSKAHPDRRDAHPGRSDAHPNRRDANPGRRDAHPDRRDSIQKATIPARTGTTLAKVDSNPLDGNQRKNSVSSAQKDSDPHPEEAGLEQTEVNKGKRNFFLFFIYFERLIK